MSVPEQIRQAVAAGELCRAARLYGEYVENAVGRLRAGDPEPALIAKAHELLGLARQKNVELREGLTADLQLSQNRAYAAERYG